jgi:dihydroorotate dehydrogenase (fumarate)
MADLSVSYMGLKLKNPIIIGSSGLTDSVSKIVELEKQGAAAVVLKSLFEEQILAESAVHVERDQSFGYDVHDYIHNHTRNHKLGDYLKLIKEAKAKVDIPVIASINCISDTEWTGFASKIEEAGADALEINISLLPSNHEMRGVQNEEMYFDILEKVRKATTLPLAVKMSPYSGGLANLIKRISWSGYVDGIVLFNRYYSPDIDTEHLRFTHTNVFSTPHEISTSLRWIAISSNFVEIDLAASTGVHSGNDIVKQMLAGAKVVEIASVIYKNGPEHLQSMIAELEAWMAKHNYDKLDDFRGLMSYDKTQETAAYERIQFMRHFSGIE